MKKKYCTDVRYSKSVDNAVEIISLRTDLEEAV
jgi:hypothetical protein